MKEGCRNAQKQNNIEENEREVDDIYRKLLEKHASNWDTPRLRLWARCICSNQHESYDNPPKLPAFNDPQPKKRKESFTDAITEAAVAFASVVSGAKNHPSSSNEPSSSNYQSGSLAANVAVSPGKVVELRMRNYEQLRYLQKLFDDGILSDKEFAEQKSNILGFLRKIQ